MTGPDPSISSRLLAPLSAGVAMSVIALSVLSIPLAAAAELELTPGEIAAWILALYGLAGVLALILTFRYRQPLLVTGNVFIMIFVASLGAQLSWGELVAASMAAGALVLVVGLLGLTERLTTWLPAPIVYGLLAGAVLPFFVGLFDALEDSPLPVSLVLASYAVAAVVFAGRVPPILPALVVGFILAVASGETTLDPAGGAFSFPALTAPRPSLDAFLSATPVMMVLITLQANVPSVVFLRGTGYEPPERVLTGVSGLGTLAGSLLGPVGISLSLPATSIVAGEDAGEVRFRHRGVYVVGAASVLIAVLAGYATEFSQTAPRALLEAVVGLAVLGVLVNALREATRGPLVIGPLVALATSQSGLSLLGLGPFFWALALGLAASLVLERKGWRTLRGERGPAA